jgi:hypothetical protein
MGGYLGGEKKEDGAMSTPLNNHVRDIFPPLLLTSRKRNYRMPSLKPTYHITPVPPCQENFSHMKPFLLSPNDGCRGLIRTDTFYWILDAACWILETHLSSPDLKSRI